MEKSSSSHNYGCSNSQEIRHILENRKGDDNYKTLHIKIRTQYSSNQYTNKLFVYCVGDYDVQKNPPITLIMRLTKTIQSSHPTSFQH